MESNLQLRKVPPKALYELAQILECGNDWKKLMCVVQKDANGDLLKYNYEHVKLIEDASGYQRRPCAEIFLEEWGTSGKKQPTLHTLLQLLQKAELFRAAEYVAVELLKESVPERPKTGPAAAIDVSEENIKRLIDSRLQEEKLVYQMSKNVENEDVFSNSALHSYVNTNETNAKSTTDYIKESSVISYGSYHIDSTHISKGAEFGDDTLKGLRELPEENTLHIPYFVLEKCTNNFCETPIIPDQPTKGGKLGTGAFGSVFLGVVSSMKVAVKRLKDDAVSVEKQFKNEVETLSRYQHENLLPLLQYSCDGPYFCLVYAYMSNGSLQDRLACKGSVPVLTWQERINIALGTAKGILYLHTAFETPLIHRDVKSANILLNDNLVPKLGDFGLVRLGPSEHGRSVAETTTVFGTSAYMAREAFWGDISVKLDSFSFGVVLLELLTSLASYDENREDRVLISYVQDSCEKSIKPLLDYKAGTWIVNENQDASEIMYLLALECLKERRQSRPDMNKIVEELEQIKHLISAWPFKDLF